MTYPKVTEIKRVYAEALTAAEDAGAPNPQACADRYLQGLNRSALSAHEVQQQRIDQWRAQSIQYPQHPTVCPKR